MWKKIKTVFQSVIVSDNAELVEETFSRKCNHVVDCKVGTVVKLFGIITSVTIPAYGYQDPFIADLNDGTDLVELVFIGRHIILGINPGVKMEVEGRLMVNKRTDHYMLINPKYCLVASGDKVTRYT